MSFESPGQTPTGELSWVHTQSPRSRLAWNSQRLSCALMEFEPAQFFLEIESSLLSGLARGDEGWKKYFYESQLSATLSPFVPGLELQLNCRRNILDRLPSLALLLSAEGTRLPPLLDRVRLIIWASFPLHWISLLVQSFQGIGASINSQIEPFSE